MSDKPIKTPLDQGFIRRVVEGFRYVATGDGVLARRVGGVDMKDAPSSSQPRQIDEGQWMGPGNPPRPQAPLAAGRAFDFQTGINLNNKPRLLEPISFEQLRALADNFDLLRLVIETRKDQLVGLNWNIVPRIPVGATNRPKSDERCHELMKFFSEPDKENDFATWLRLLLEDLFVVDAPTIYVRKNKAGGVYSLDVIDGTTVKRVIDEGGRTPMPPFPAYQQIIKGFPAVDYTRDELLYMPRNRRPHKIYGMSPVEQVVMTVNIAIRRQLHQLQYYTEGNVPDAIARVPASWSPEQIKMFQEYWDTLMSGDGASRRRMKFIPDGVDVQFTRLDGGIKDDFDEWLARIITYAFSVPNLPLVPQQNRATAQTAVKAAMEEGLAPLMNWVKRLIDRVIASHFGYADLEFMWEQKDSLDGTERASVNNTYIRSGVKSLDEARTEVGLEPYGVGPIIFGVGPLGFIFVEDLKNPEVRKAAVTALMNSANPQPFGAPPAMMGHNGGPPMTDDPLAGIPAQVLQAAGLPVGPDNPSVAVDGSPEEVTGKTVPTVVEELRQIESALRISKGGRLYEDWLEDLKK